ncbi:hypothetical protein FQZ97_1228910 [compost metagenome]
MFDVRHRLTEHLLRRRLQSMQLEQGKSRRQGAGGDKAAAEPYPGRLYAQGIFQRAIRRRAAISQRRVTQRRRAQDLLA